MAQLRGSKLVVAVGHVDIKLTGLRIDNDDAKLGTAKAPVSLPWDSEALISLASFLATCIDLVLPGSYCSSRTAERQHRNTARCKIADHFSNSIHTDFAVTY